ncbi:MAG: PEP-utilizing enzyme [bacterium]|nr:PEP-utilizing enzyme [bacterium]
MAVQVAQSWNFAWGEAMKKIYGVSLKNTLVFRDDKKTEYYVDEKQYKKYINDLYKLLENDKFVKNFHQSARTTLENILKNTKKRFNKNLAKLSNRELLKLYQNFTLPNVEQFYIRMWTVFNIAEPLADVVRKNLAKYTKDDEQINRYLLKLSSPLRPNDILNEKIDLLKLSSQKNRLNSQQFLKKIKRLVKKYRHIPMFDFDHEPYSEKYFLNEIKTIENPEKELDKMKKLFTDHNKDLKKIIREIKPDRKFNNLLQFLKENVVLRDYRDMLRQKLNLELRKLYNEIAHRLGLAIEQIATLTNDEIINCLNSNKKFPQTEVKNRAKAYLLIQKDRQVEIYSGQKAINKFNKELIVKKQIIGREIKGIIGSKGIARGIVKIVYTNKDLNKIKKGDILVTAMTRQDFVPIMKKVRAIVTDEGGIICHAAIIARELKIPAIVGTKIATQVLKDGNRVEVDANNGLVKIIKRNKKSSFK